MDFSVKNESLIKLIMCTLLSWLRTKIKGKTKIQNIPVKNEKSTFEQRIPLL